jgi:hypothetical protein
VSGDDRALRQPEFDFVTDFAGLAGWRQAQHAGGEVIADHARTSGETPG